MNQCPCGACVTCECDAIPPMDEDGLCAGCGGQPYVLAKLSGDPHVGSGDGIPVDRARVEAIINDPETAPRVATWIAAYEKGAKYHAGVVESWGDAGGA